MDLIPEARRGAVDEALWAAFGAQAPRGWRPILGGASGALLLQFEVAARAYVLRLESPWTDLPFRRRGFRCLVAAAAAGAAPALHYADAEAGVAVMDFVATRSLADYPGGPLGLAQALGELTARVRSAPPFPRGDYRVGCDILLKRLQDSGLFAPGLLAPHAEELARIHEALPWDPEALVPSHNDLNPGNILFDGQRLWLVDWGLGFQNDPLVDLAVLTHRGAWPELEDALLTAAFGRPPDQVMRARLTVIRQLTWLFYGGIALADFTVGPAGRTAPGGSETTLDACDWDAHAATIARLGVASPESLYSFGKTALAAFLAGVRAPEFEAALATVRG
jgi:aminoglycoside phosphotransferase (APT) family kinase protein